MNRIWAAIAILVLLFGLCLAAVNQTLFMTGDIVQQVQLLETEIKNDNMKEASVLSKKTIQTWHDYHIRMSYYVPHNRLDEISETLSALPPFIQQDNKEEALAECARALDQLQMLWEMELPYPNNIL